MRMGMVKDAVYYLHRQSGASDDKARGVIVGLMAGLMAHGGTFEESMAIIAKAINDSEEKSDFRMELFPECWVAELKKNMS